MKKVIINRETLKLLDRKKTFLNRSDITIFPASDNREVFEIHSREKANLIITTFDSPDMDGQRLCESIRKDDELNKVSIILICPGNIDVSDKLVDIGANSLLPCSVSTETLIEEAERLLNIARRRTVRVDLSIEIHGSSDRTTYSGMIENISSSGILFQSEAVLDEGDRIRCNFALPEMREINTEAEIVRVVEGHLDEDGRRCYYYGASFVDITPETHSSLEEFINRHV
ncbi:MAG TPA: response regulator [Nitrospirae bacterium]|nr:response regulator [Nitrospirota bacterium]